MVKETTTVEAYFQEMSLIMQEGDSLVCEVNEDGDLYYSLRGYEGTVLNTFNSYSGEYIKY